MRIAAKVALEKQDHPERFCPAKKCLWRTGGGHCPRHARSPSSTVEVTYRLCRHAAHTGPGTGWDLDRWIYAQPARLPRPEVVPVDAEYHSGFLDAGIQHWVYVRIAPLSEGMCSTCENDSRLRAPKGDAK